MEDYLWYTILHYWCNTKQPNGSGLSIPFLIGLEKEFGRGKNYEIKNLLTEFHSIQGTYSITIRNCTNINMDVCCLDILNEQERAYYQNFGSIYLEVNDYIESKTFNDFILTVKSEYIGYVDQKHYSINNGLWSYFIDADLKMINNII